MQSSPQHKGLSEKASGRACEDPLAIVHLANYLLSLGTMYYRQSGNHLQGERLEILKFLSIQICHEYANDFIFSAPVLARLPGHLQLITLFTYVYLP